MHSINGKPFISLDKYVDVKTLLDLENKWNLLFSSNLDNIKTAVWNAAGHNPYEVENFPNVFRESEWLYFSLQKANQDRKTDKELDRHLDNFESKNDKKGLARYLKLRYKSFDPLFALNIRKNCGPFYSADSNKLKDEDWDKYHVWQPYMDNFPEIKSFIYNLPLEKIGNVVIHYLEHYAPLGYHRDLNYFPYEDGIKKIYPHREEFIWLRFDLNRPFYIFDIDKKRGTVKKQIPVEGYSAFFNHHQWHGSFDHYPNASLTIKVEGKFTKDLRRSLGIENLKNYY